jgi:Mn2+/Fe2+ NRAMP family transporter
MRLFDGAMPINLHWGAFFTEMSGQNLSTLLNAFAIVMLIGAVVTLVPHDSLQLSDLGYHTFCPFAPWSTITLLVLAGLGWVIRRHIDNLPE